MSSEELGFPSHLTVSILRERLINLKLHSEENGISLLRIINLSQSLTPGNYQSILYSVAFSRLSCERNHTVCSLLLSIMHLVHPRCYIYEQFIPYYSRVAAFHAVD